MACVAIREKLYGLSRLIKRTRNREDYKSAFWMREDEGTQEENKKKEGSEVDPNYLGPLIEHRDLGEI